MKSDRLLKLACSIVAAGLFFSSIAGHAAAPTLSGELKQWHKITLTLEGPAAGESEAEPNPFMDYRLDVTFTHESGSPRYQVPGYFAADGHAAETSATSGNKWRAHLSPDKPGQWTYQVSFVKGPNVAVESAARAVPVNGCDGLKGAFNILPTDKTGRDFRAKGRLAYVGGHYLQFAGNKEYFLKAGADAPENFLAYREFDGDFARDGHQDHFIKDYQPHVRDWKEGDPSWQNGKGKGIIGALNYLASKGMNAFSFLPMNIGGDDQNVFPYTSYQERLRLDISRLEQWEIVFEHAQKLGLFLHFKTQEAENQKLLDGGEAGPQRRLYYRELIARFGHHLALNWNLGEENGTWGPVKGQSSAQRRAMAQFFFDLDPYHHPIVIHNGQWFDDLYGNQSKLTGASLQTSLPDFSEVHRETLRVYRESEAAGKPWAVACDEPGDAEHALVTDQEDPNHDNARQNALWGTLLAGGYGVEWYFGYAHPQSDLTLQDWRSRDKMWEQSRFALEFFKNYEIPFWTMRPSDALSHSDDWVLASAPDARPFYAVIYTRDGGDCVFDLPSGRYDYGWFNPHSGLGLTGLLAPGKTPGGRQTKLSAPDSRDWILLIGPEGGLNPKDLTLAPTVLEFQAIYDFKPSKKEGYVPYYVDQNNRAPAINAAQYKNQFAAGELAFPGPSGTYDVILTTMTETDGESSYRLMVQGRPMGEFKNPATQEDYVLARHRWKNVSIQNGDELLVAFNTHSNRRTPEGDGYAYSRGRWRSLAFVKPGMEYTPFVVLDWEEEMPAPDTSGYFKFDFDPAQAEHIFEEKHGLVVVEAEHFSRQTHDQVRRWYLTTATQAPAGLRDGDGNHAATASGGAYLEILPDTRRHAKEPLIRNENFTEDPGRMAVLYYPVYFNTPGKYYVWARSCPTGPEDNGLHVGLDGQWPASGMRLQWIAQQSAWQWDSKQRTELVHTGVKYRVYLEVKEPGLHTVMFSMREDGFEMDKWLMSTNKDVLKHGETGMGPDESPVRP